MKLSQTLFLIGSLTALGACGSSGNDAPTQQPTLFFGSTKPDTSISGLEYADGTQNPDDLKGQTHTVRMVRLETNTVTGETVEIISDEKLTITSVGDNGLMITLDGEMLTFKEGPTTLADGSYRGSIYHRI